MEKNRIFKIIFIPQIYVILTPPLLTYIVTVILLNK